MIEFIGAATFYNTIARYYDAENETVVNDLAYFADLAAEYGDPILDVGCGTGRVTFHLAEAGHRVVGIDVSRAMLDRARRKLSARADLADLRQHISLHEGDAIAFAYPESYPLILIPYNGFLHLGSQSAQIALLTHLAKYLDESGRLVIDAPNAGDRFASVDDNAVGLERSFIEPESGNLVMQQAVSRIDRATQTEYINWIYDEIGKDSVLRRTLAPLELRHVFAAEMDLMLRLSGLKLVNRFGDYDESPFEDGSPRMITIAERAG